MGRFHSQGDGLFGPTDKQFRQRAEHSYEYRVVSHLFSRYGLPPARRRLMADACYNRTEVRRLTLEDFEEQFPSFPLRLRCRKIPKLDKAVTIARLFSNFLHIELAKEHRALVDSTGNRDVVLVAAWPRLRGQIVQKKTADRPGERERGGDVGLAVHNCFPPNFAVRGTRIINNRDEERGVVIEPLSMLLAALDISNPVDSWLPEE